jgi:molecular chaperone DnaK
MTYRLGVDLGTTFTAAAVANGGPPTMLGLGNRALQVPSVLYLPSEGDLVVGEAAERRGATDPSRVVREFKRRIGDHVPLLVAGVPYSPQALTAQLLHWVVDASTTQMGEPPSQVVLTYPANWGPYKRELLAQVVELADVGDVITCSEPEAAATQYAARSRIQPGDRIVMYDLGGGTFDTCVLEKTDDSFVMRGEPVGIEHLGGIDFDDAVFQHVIEALSDRVQDLDSTDPDMQAGLARLRRDCVEAKEALSSDTHTVVPVALGGWSTSVRLTRSELEDLIRAPLEETVAAVGRAIRSAGLQPADLSAIVLVGGGSRIPLVREMLQQQFPVATALDTHPKHDVALGAVQVGTRGAGPASAVSSAVSATPETVAAASASAATTETAPLTSPITEPIPPVDPYADPAVVARAFAFEATQEVAPDVAAKTAPKRTPKTAPRTAPRTAPETAPETATETAPETAPAKEFIPPQLRPVTSRPAEIGGAAGPRLGGPGTGGARPGDGGRAWRRPAALVAAAVVAVLALGGGIVALTRGNNDTGRPDVATTKTAPSPTGTSTTGAGLQLPASTPLSAQQLLIGMQVDRNWDIYLADIRRGEPVRKLTDDPQSDFSPSLSPDRRSVIFVHQEGTARTLRVMAADGTGVRDLFKTTPPQCASVFRPAWNPVDPTELAVACIDASGSSGLYLIRVDGTIQRKLPVGQPRVDDPAFSPDGTKVAYQAGSDSAFDGGSIFTIGVDGGKPQRITNSKPGTDADPAWSDDGSQIAFRRRLPDGTTTGNFDIFVVPVEESKAPNALVKGESDDQDPSWSPNGRQLVFKSNRLTPGGKGAGAARIWVVNSDGSGVRVLWTQGVQGNEQGAPAWTRR